MVGRKPAIEPLEVVEAVMHFKERVVMNDDGDNRSKYLLIHTYHTLLIFVILVKNIVVHVPNNNNDVILESVTQQGGLDYSLPHLGPYL